MTKPTWANIKFMEEIKPINDSIINLDT